MTMKTYYRIDFSRLARTMEEIARNKLSKEFLAEISPKVVASKLIEFDDSLKTGHILDYKIIQDKPDKSGIDVLKEHVLPLYPEAQLMSWDYFEK